MLVALTMAIRASIMAIGTLTMAIGFVARAQAPPPPPALANPALAIMVAGDGTTLVATVPDAAPASAFGSFLASRHAESIYDLVAAADFITEAFAQDPENKDLLRRTFVLMAAAGRLDEAAGMALEIAGDKDVGSVAGILLVIEEVKAGNLASAVERLETMPRDGISSMVAPLMLAWVRYEEAGPEAGIEVLESLGGRIPFATMLEMHLALINDLAGRDEAADAAYQAALEHAERMPFRLAQAFAAFLRRAGRDEDARTLYRDYARTNPASDLLLAARDALERGGGDERIARTAAEGMAEVLFGTAGTLYRQGDLQVSLIFANLALRLRPDFPIAHFLVADLQTSLGRHEDAIETYRLIPSDETLDWPARLRLATGLAALDQTDDAILELEEMAAERVDQYEPLFRVGNILRGQERFAEAVDAYDRAVARIAALGDEHWPILYARGIALERSRQWARAEADLLKALEMRPEHPYVLNYLGYSWADQGKNLDEALDMIERAVRQRPTDGYIVDSLGWVYYRIGKYEKAVDYLERSVELRPGDPVINDHLGDAFWMVGRRNEARFQWRRSIALDAEPELAVIIRAKIEDGLQTPGDDQGSE
jgi:tetratricopeptide (TPR) repeat protein